MSDPILAGEGLSKRYGPVTALDDVDFAVFPGRSSPSSATTAPASRPSSRPCPAP